MKEIILEECKNAMVDLFRSKLYLFCRTVIFSNKLTILTAKKQRFKEN